MKPKVKILMSTYNGEKYLAAQLDSLLAQEDVHVDLDIRDDGSSDGTLAILERYARDYTCIHVARGENVGPAASFMTLLYAAGDGFDYYAFSDQDDIWDADKLASGIGMIARQTGSCLYYSALNTFNDETGERQLRANSREFSFAEVFLKSQFPGCTMVMNREAFKAIQGVERPQATVMHDLFVVQVLMGLGQTIVYDQQSHINYRIHGSNVSVKTGGQLGELRRLARISHRQRGLRLEAAREYRRVMGFRLDGEQRATLDVIVDYRESLAKKLQMMRLIRDTAFDRVSRLLLEVAVAMNVF